MHTQLIQVAAPQDHSNTVIPEVCFGQRQDAAYFTRDCLPPHKEGSARPELRFSVDDRVACLVEDPSGDFAEWKSGKVTELWARPTDKYELDFWRADDAAAYRVDLDDGGRVLVHRDDHILVRDLLLQAEGPRSNARFTKRQRADGDWESVDHQTRIVRKCSAPSDASDSTADSTTDTTADSAADAPSAPTSTKATPALSAPKPKALSPPVPTARSSFFSRSTMFRMKCPPC